MIISAQNIPYWITFWNCYITCSTNVVRIAWKEFFFSSERELFLDSRKALNGPVRVVCKAHFGGRTWTLNWCTKPGYDDKTCRVFPERDTWSDVVTRCKPWTALAWLMWRSWLCIGSLTASRWALRSGWTESQATHLRHPSSPSNRLPKRSLRYSVESRTVAWVGHKLHSSNNLIWVRIFENQYCMDSQV
jgi:hypothetical protein